MLPMAHPLTTNWWHRTVWVQWTQSRRTATNGNIAITVKKADLLAAECCALFRWLTQSGGRKYQPAGRKVLLDFARAFKRGGRDL
jgi:hypothetical protein